MGSLVFTMYTIEKMRQRYHLGQNKETGANEATRTAIFGIVPSVTYNFKF